MSIRALLLVLMVITSFILPFIVPVSAISLEEIDNAIAEGVKYVYRSVVFLDSDWTKAVMRDHPAIPITLEYNGNYYMPGGFLDPGNRDYYHEFFNISSTGFSIRYYFNLDQSGPYDVIIKIDITNIDEVKDKVFIKVEKCSFSSVKLIYGWSIDEEIYEGWTKTLTIPYYYTSHYSHRYVARHSTRIAAWLLEDEGYDEYAQALHNFMDDLGFYYDVYAPLFGRSNNYPDNFFDYKYSTWLGNGYNAHPWITDYSCRTFLYPYKSRLYIFDAIGSFYEGLRGWKSAPLYKLLKAVHLLNKYGSSKASEAGQLILEALEDGGWDGYGLSRAKIDPFYVLYGSSSSLLLIPYHYRGYPVYLNAALLIAVVRYYQVTGQSYLNGYDLFEIMDRLAGILLKIQWIYTQNTPWGTLSLAMYRGGWPAAYDKGPSGELIVTPSAWGIIDTVTSGFDMIAGAVWKAHEVVGVAPPEDLTKALLPMPGEFPTIVNSESTILAIQALKIYRQLGRIPIDITPEIPYEGVFIGGGGSGTLYSDGMTSEDGYTIYASAYTLWGVEQYRDQWAIYKLYNDIPMREYVCVRGMARYYLSVGDSGGLAELKIQVYVYDLNDNLVGSYEEVIDSIDSPASEINGFKAVIISFPIDNLEGGWYKIEVNIRATAIGEAEAIISGKSPYYGQYYFKVISVGFAAEVEEDSNYEYYYF